MNVQGFKLMISITDGSMIPPMKFILDTWLVSHDNL